MTATAARGNTQRLVRWLVATALIACGGAALYVLSADGSMRFETRAGAIRPAALQTGYDRDFEDSSKVRLRGLQMVVQSRGTIVLVHGLGEPDSLYGYWAAALNGATQMNVLAVALRGNGRSRDSVPRGDRPDDFAADIGSVLRELKRRQPSGPVILLASHGGTGIVAHYERRRRDMGLIAPEGIIVLRSDSGIPAHVANGRPLVYFHRRARLIAPLARLGIPFVDGLTVAMQDAGGRELTTRWSYRAWEAAATDFPALAEAQRASGTPMLVISAEKAVGPSTVGDRSWDMVPAPVDPNTPAVARSIARWTAQFSADAFDPTPPKATQTLELLPRR